MHEQVLSSPIQQLKPKQPCLLQNFTAAMPLWELADCQTQAALCDSPQAEAQVSAMACKPYVARTPPKSGCF